MPKHNFGYVVIRESDKKLKRHVSFKSAKDQAERLARKEREQFCVLKPVLLVYQTEVPVNSDIIAGQHDFWPDDESRFMPF